MAPDTAAPHDRPMTLVLASVRRHRALAAVVGTALVAFVGAGIAIGSPLALSYGAAVLALGVAVAALDARVPLSTPVLRGLAAWAVLHLAGGIVPLGEGRILYNARLGPPLVRYDRLVHAFGFGIATIACWEVLRPHLREPRPAFGIAAATMGMGLGALNEVVEFLASRVATTHVGGYRNTGWDLVFNLVGCAAAGVTAARGASRRRNPRAG